MGNDDQNGLFFALVERTKASQIAIHRSHERRKDMALGLFDRPIYAQRKYFIQEITGLDEVFDFLDEWPEEIRNVAYEVMVDACRKAANCALPVAVVHENRAGSGNLDSGDKWNFCLTSA
jgi:hypothetical protein